jgi:hypothetical protein
MKVINRSQVTKVVTERSVHHTLDLNGKIYTRLEKVKVEIPYMDCNVLTNNSSIEWFEYVKPNVSSKLTTKEIKELDLENLFSQIDLNSRNGNNY